MLLSCSRAGWREADAKMNQAAQAARAAGFEPMAGPHNTFGAFTSPGRTNWRVHLEAHSVYFLAAACTGCDVLDFTINEPHGATIGEDTTQAPTPRLTFEAPEEGDYHVLFDYERCTAAPCHWVAQLYEKKGTP